jgi:(p)ppGpp synthase/HD superfamily hydrolase
MSRRSPDPGSLSPKTRRLGERFHQAFLFAATSHGEQTRKKTTTPYIAHLMSVSALVLEAGGDEDLAIAALLHDVVEDCGGKPVLEEIERRFGARVAHVVAGCTDSDSYPKPPWRQRKETYLEHLRTADADVRLVSAADKLHNAREILRDYRSEGEPVWQRFGGQREGTLWYYRALVEELRRTPGNPLVDELQRVVADLEGMAQSRGSTEVNRDGARQRI